MINYSQLDFSDLNRVSAVCEELSYNCKEKEERESGCEQDIYDVVKNHIVENIGNGLDFDQAAERFNVAKGQMKVWLKRLYDDEMIVCKDGIYFKK